MQALQAAGFSPQELAAAGTGIGGETDAGLTAAIKAAGCDVNKLKLLMVRGVTAKQIHDENHCSLNTLKNVGFDVKALSDAGFTPQELLAAGFTPQDMMSAGLSPAAIIAAGRKIDCSVDALKAAKATGVSVKIIKETLGCSAKAMAAAGYTAAELKAGGYTAAQLRNAGFGVDALKAAGFTAKDLRAAGFSAAELKAAGYDASALKAAGYSAEELVKAGFTPTELKQAGFSAKELKNAGLSAAALKAAGFSVNDLKDAGYSAEQMKKAGFSDQILKEAGYSQSELNIPGLDKAPAIDNTQTTMANAAPIPSIGGNRAQLIADQRAENAKKLNEMVKKQQIQMADQKFQQQVQQRTTAMMSAARQEIQEWSKTTAQTYISGNAEKDAGDSQAQGIQTDASGGTDSTQGQKGGSQGVATIKMGDILFAVIDTSVNSDEPGPILATIVSGRLKGAKLIGSFNLPSNADKLVISFNSLSIPGAPKTQSISAYAIDPNTARTALASETNHHFIQRYGALFASTFLEGFGNAFQSANTTITVGGTGGTSNTTVSNGVGRSTLENAVIGLATLGKAWGQYAQQGMNRPTTVEVFSGTGIGVLFTQDLKITS